MDKIKQQRKVEREEAMTDWIEQVDREREEPPSHSVVEDIFSEAQKKWSTPKKTKRST